MMKSVFAALAAVAFLAAAAQSKLDQAVAKADDQLAKGKPEDAVKTLAKAAADAGAEGQVALGRLQERIGDLDAAAEAYSQAKATATGPKRADVLAAVAEFALRKGKAADAMAIAKEAVQAGATPAALAALARAQVRTEDGPGALATARKAVAAGPDSAIAHIGLGEALIEVGKGAEAVTALQRAVELDPKSALAYARLARAQLAIGKPAEAVASAKKATDADDKFGEGFAILGVAMVAQDPKSWSEAIAQAQQGAFLDPDNPNVHFAVGKIFEANGQLEQAARAHRQALAIDPAYGPARYAVIQTELNRGNREGAIAEAKKIAASGAESPDIERLIGDDAVRRQDYSGAIPFLERATEGLPGNPDGWAQEQAALGLGWAYSSMKDYDKAISAYNRAIQIDAKAAGPDANVGIAWGYFFKAVASASREDAARAKEFATKAGAAGRDVTQLKRKIAELEKAIATGRLLTQRQIEAARAEQEEYEERKREFEAANRDLGAKAPATRIRGINRIVGFAGADAVPALISLMQLDPDYDVRISACRAIGSLGPGGRQALPNIDGILRQEPYDPGINPTEEQLRTQMKDGDYRRCLRDAKAKVSR